MSASPEDTTPEPALPSSPVRRRSVTVFLRWAIAIATVAALIDAGRKAAAEARDRTATIELHPEWLAASAGFYLLGWLLQSGPWMAALPAFGGGRSNARTLAAYLVSHVGKYVPGKVMVFILRKGLLPKTPTFPIIAATFFETFAVMAGGSLLAFVTLVAYFPGSPLPILLATGGLAAIFCFAISPGIYRFAVRVLLVQRTGITDVDGDERFDARKIRVPAPSPTTIAVSLLSAILSWGLISVSFACVVRGCGAETSWDLLLPLSLLATPLAAVGGFISMIPGQLGVREWVLASLAKPLLGSDLVPLAAAVVFRLVTLVVEATVAGLLYFSLRKGSHG